jgi:membrane-bound ClpP family serine protease
MGAHSQQAWSLLVFLLGFTFLPAGLFALGPVFTIAGAVCLIVAAVWFYRIKPLEYAETNKVQPHTPAEPPGSEFSAIKSAASGSR